MTNLRLESEPPPAIEPLLTAKQVAEIVNVRPKRVYELSIESVRISNRQVRWRLETVRRWIEEREGVR